MQMTHVDSSFGMLAILFFLGMIFCILVATIAGAIFSGSKAGKIVLGLGISGLLMIVVLCSGAFFFTSVPTQQPPRYIHSEFDSAYGNQVTREAKAFDETHQIAHTDAEVVDESDFLPEPVSIDHTETSESPLPSRDDSLSHSDTSQGSSQIPPKTRLEHEKFRKQLKLGELSVDPSSIIPPGRPAWVEQAPEWRADRTYLVAVSSGPYDRGMDCRTALDAEVDQAIGQFANELLRNDQASQLLSEELDTLKESVVAETYQEELTPSFGIMHQWHSLLEFDETIQQKIRQFWEVQQRVSRVVYIGAGFLGLLGLLFIGYASMSLTGEGSRISPWLVSAGTVVALGGLLAAGVIFVQSFPML